MESQKTGDRRSSPDETTGRKRAKLSEEDSKNNHEIFGIGVFEMKDSTSLENEERWRSELKFSEIYYPTHASKHRNTVFLIYDDKSTRDTAFHSEEIERIDFITVAKVCFEIDSSDQPSEFVETLFHDIKNTISRPNILPNQRSQIKEYCMITLSKCYKMLKECSTTISSTMDPDPDTLQWFLVCEILLFFIYNIMNSPAVYLIGVINCLTALGWKLFNTKLKALDQHTRVFIIDTLWQEVFYSKGKTIWFTMACGMLISDNSLIKLSTVEPNLPKFHEILCNERIQEILRPFIVNGDYLSLITQILENTFLVEFPDTNHGLTLPNRSIVIDLKNEFTNTLHVSAFRLVILIHEIGHFIVRLKCRSFQDFLEYKSPECSFEEPPRSKKKSKKIYSIPESGFELEKQIFGDRLNKLNSLAAEFIMDNNNWLTKDFQKMFRKLNSKTKDSDGNRLESVRMRTSINDQLEFINNWCLTSHYRSKTYPSY